MLVLLLLLLLLMLFVYSTRTYPCTAWYQPFLLRTGNDTDQTIDTPTANITDMPGKKLCSCLIFSSLSHSTCVICVSHNGSRNGAFKFSLNKSLEHVSRSLAAKAISWGRLIWDCLWRGWRIIIVLCLVKTCLRKEKNSALSFVLKTNWTASIKLRSLENFLGESVCAALSTKLKAFVLSFSLSRAFYFFWEFYIPWILLFLNRNKNCQNSPRIRPKYAVTYNRQLHHESLRVIPRNLGTSS